MAITVRDIREKEKQAQDSRFEARHNDIPGVIKSVDGYTRPPAQQGMTWVSILNQPESRVLVRNATSIDVEETPVWIGPETKPPYRLEIKGLYLGGIIPNAGSTASGLQVGRHSQIHQYPSEDNAGPDPVLVFQPAIQPLKCTGNGTSLTVTIQPLKYFYSGRPVHFRGANVDLTSYVPTTSGRMLRVLVYLDEETNTIDIVSSPEVESGGAVSPSYPDLPANGRPSCYIELTYGQTSITTATHIEDWRDLLNNDIPYNSTQAPELKNWTATVVTHPNATGNVTLDYQDGNVHQLVLTGNVTLAIDNPPSTGKYGELTIRAQQDSTGGWSITWPGTVTWLGIDAPTESTGPNTIDVYKLFTIDGGAVYVAWLVDLIAAPVNEGFTFNYLFDTGTGTPPGSGEIRFNNATIASVTSIYIHDTDNSGTDLDLVLDEIGTGSLLGVFSGIDDHFAVFSVTSVTDSGTYHTVGGTYLANNGTFADAESIFLGIEAGGGGGGISGTGTDNHITRWDGTTAVQDSDVVIADDGSIVQTVEDAVTSTVTSVFDFIKNTTGTAAAGFGAKLRMLLENSSGTNIVSGEIENKWISASNEDAQFIIRFMQNSDLSEAIVITPDTTANDVAGTTRGEGSYDLQSARVANTNVPAAYYSGLFAGENNSVGTDGFNSVVLGGKNSIADGWLAAILGGDRVHADKAGEIAFGGFNFSSVLGSAQASSLLVGRAITTHTDTTWFPLYTDASSEVLTMTYSSSLWHVNAYIIGLTSGTSQRWAYSITDILPMRNSGGAMVLLSGGTVTELYESDTAYEVRAVVNASGWLEIQVRRNGGTNYSIRWLGRVEIVQLRY